MTSAEAPENRTAEMVVRKSNAEAAPRYTRRLSDKILTSFHQACDQKDFQVAQPLLGILGVILIRPPPPLEIGSGRRNVDCLVAAYERLWHLQHATADDR
jgi:hypothetical protein